MDGPWQIDPSLPRECDTVDPRLDAPKCQSAFFDFLVTKGYNKSHAFQLAFQERHVVACYSGMCSCEEQLYVYSGPTCAQDTIVTYILLAGEALALFLSLVFLVRGSVLFYRRFKAYQLGDRKGGEGAIGLAAIAILLASLLCNMGGICLFFHGYNIFSFHVLWVTYLLFFANMLTQLSLFLVSVMWARVAEQLRVESRISRLVVSKNALRVYIFVIISATILILLSWQQAVQGDRNWIIVMRVTDITVLLAMIIMSAACAADVYRVTCFSRDGSSGLNPGMAGIIDAISDVAHISFGKGYLEARKQFYDHLRAEKNLSVQGDTHQVDQLFVHIQFRLVGATTRIFYFGLFQIIGSIITIFTQHKAATQVWMWPIWVTIGRLLLLTFVGMQWTILHYFSRSDAAKTSSTTSGSTPIGKGNAGVSGTAFDSTFYGVESAVLATN